MTDPETILAMFEAMPDCEAEEARWAREQLRELSMLCDSLWTLTTWADAAARKAAMCGIIEECEQDARLAADLYLRAKTVARERHEAALAEQCEKALATLAPAGLLLKGGGR